MDKKKIQMVGIIIVILLYGIFANWRCSYVQITSDYANLVLEGRDLLQGDFFRSDWNLTGISFLTTDLPYFVVGVALFGVTNKAYIFACALMQTMLVAVACLLLKDCLQKHKFSSTIIMLAFSMLPCLFAIDLLRAHTGGFIVAFLEVYVFNLLINRKNKSLLLIGIYIVLMALAVMGDPIILILIVLPICIWSAITWLNKGINTKTMFLHIFINSCGVLVGTICDKLYFKIGGANKNAFLDSKIFISWDDLYGKLITYLRGVLYLSDAAFETKSIMDVHTLLYALNTIAVILFFMVVLYNIKCFVNRKQYDFITVILGTGFLIMSVLFIVTNIATDIAGARYICFLPTLMAIVFIRNFTALVVGKERIYMAIIAVALVVVSGKIYNLKTDVQLNGIPQNANALINILEENHLTNGYASFWNASSVTVLSNEKVKVRAIIDNNQRFQMHNWFCKNEWYAEPANFIVTLDDDISGITKHNVEAVLGVADKNIICGQYEILVYDFDISKFLSNGLDDGVLNAFEWYGNEKTRLEDNERVLYAGGMLWGPYSSVAEGKYAAIIHGRNLDNAEFDVYSNKRGTIVERQTIDQSKDFSFNFDLNEAVDDLEIRVYNNSNEQVEIKGLNLYSPN